MSVGLAPVPVSVWAARRAVDELLDGAGADELAVPLTLIVSELVSNAVVHGSRDSQIYLKLVLYHRHVHVSVRNLGTALNMKRLRDRQPNGGRGLDIVCELADSWAIEAGPAGTIVTARIRWGTDPRPGASRRL